MEATWLKIGRDEHSARSYSMTSDPPTHRLAKFAGIGGIATVVQLGLFGVLQMVIPQFWANIVAWSVSTVIANTANRSLTFGVHGSEGAQRDFLVSTGFSLLALVASVLVLDKVDTSSPLLSVLLLIAVNTAVSGLRFAALRWWFAVRLA